MTFLWMSLELWGTPMYTRASRCSSSHQTGFGTWTCETLAWGNCRIWMKLTPPYALLIWSWMPLCSFSFSVSTECASDAISYCVRCFPAMVLRAAMSATATAAEVPVDAPGGA